MQIDVENYAKCDVTKSSIGHTALYKATNVSYYSTYVIGI